MILWTIKTVDEMSILDHQGFLSCDERFVDSDFLSAYGWMAKKLSQKVPKTATNPRYPIWLWKCWDKHKSCKPDLRVRWGRRGEELVLVKLDISEELILLSEFDLWHYVLNKWFLPKDKKEFELYRNLIAGDKKFEQLEEKEKEFIKKSWDRVLSWDSLDNSFHNKLGSSIQAVTWEIKKEWILHTREFISK